MSEIDKRPTSGDLPIAIYNAFTSVPYAGSPAAIVLNSRAVPREQRERIAREIGLPATAFVDEVSETRISAQFFSTVMELPMCGHGTMCLITSLAEEGMLARGAGLWRELALALPQGDAHVEYRENSDGRVEVKLDVAVASLESIEIDEDKLARLLNLAVSDVASELPLMVARADFVHLCVPIRDLRAMAKIAPDYPALAQFCRENGLQTVAAFSMQTVDANAHVHVRDFCPAVGVAEAAAAGTTNAALAAYLVLNNVLPEQKTGQWRIRAEQGVELHRPSQITTTVFGTSKSIKRIQVGGLASRVIRGCLNAGLGSQ